MKNSLWSHFTIALRLPADAADWLLGLWTAIQVFDDVADGDTVSRNDLTAAIVNTLIVMPANPFFRAHVDQLTPVLTLAFLKWSASDTAERNGRAGPKSYMWRASYYDVVMIVVALCHGVSSASNDAEAVMNLYGETLDGYMKEFENA